MLCQSLMFQSCTVESSATVASQRTLGENAQTRPSYELARRVVSSALSGTLHTSQSPAAAARSLPPPEQVAERNGRPESPPNRLPFVDVPSGFSGHSSIAQRCCPPRDAGGGAGDSPPLTATAVPSGEKMASKTNSKSTS